MTLGKACRHFLFSVGLVAASVPQPVRACAACFGQSDSSAAKGMNMGIFSLLLVVVVVLSGIASFFVFVARRTAARGMPNLSR